MVILTALRVKSGLDIFCGFSFRKGVRMSDTVLLAPACGGKDTQTNIIHGVYPEVSRKSSGDIGRAIMERHRVTIDAVMGALLTRHKTDATEKMLISVVETAIKTGGLIPVQYIRAFMDVAFATVSNDNRLIVWNGFVRQDLHAKYLHEKRIEVGRKCPLRVIYFRLSHEECLRRLEIRNKQALEQGRKLRVDDDPETIIVRLDHYDREVASIARYLNDISDLVDMRQLEIDASAAPDVQAYEIQEFLELPHRQIPKHLLPKIEMLAA
jgi:adenylate kinase family enzyme